METTAQKLIKLADIKESIRRAIVDKGFELAEGASFAEYAVALGGTAPSHSAFNNTDDRIKYIGDIKNAIRAAIIAGGVDVPENTSFGAYASKIAEITTDVYAILYSDGTFVFQSDDVADTSHGTVVAKYNGFLDNVYTSNDQIPWTANRDKIKKIEMKCKVKPADTSYMFYGMPNLTSCDIKLLDTSKSTNMKYMFYNCTSLPSVDLSNFNTSNVTDMQHMFGSCTALTKLDLSSFNTSKVTSMYYMFYRCSKITDIDVSSFDVSKVTKFYGMFRDCSALVNIDTSRFKTSSATDMQYMFSGCTNLKYVELCNFDASKVTAIRNMFYKCATIKYLDLSTFDMNSVTDAQYMFDGMTGLETVHLGAKWKWVGSNCYLPDGETTGSDIGRMGGGVWCSESNGTPWSTSNIPTGTAEVYHRFGYIRYNNMAYAIVYSDGTLVFQRSNTADSSHGSVVASYTGFENRGYAMYSAVPWYANKDQIKKVEVKAHEIPIRPVSTGNWFYKYPNLTSVDLSNLNAVRVTTANRMFLGSAAITDIDLSNFKTTKNESTLGMFMNCSELKSVDLTGLDMTTVTSAGDMFTGAAKLQDVAVGDRWKWLDGGRLPDGDWYDAKKNPVSVGNIPDGKGNYYGDVGLVKLLGKVSVVSDYPTIINGDTLTAVVDGVQDDVELRYEWKRKCDESMIDEPILGANGTQYTLTKYDANMQIQCIVTDASGKYTGSIDSQWSLPVVYFPMHSSLADYSAEELKYVAEDLSANGNSSRKYEEFHGYLERDEHWQFQLTDGTDIKMRIAGICHDTKESNGSYAGLTMQATKALPDKFNSTMDTSTNESYENLELCKKLNRGGEIYNLIPQDVRENIELVRKCSFYVFENSNYQFEPSTNIWYFDVWIPSIIEIYGDTPNDAKNSDISGAYEKILAESNQYEFWKKQGVNPDTDNTSIANLGSNIWFRTQYPRNPNWTSHMYFCTSIYDMGSVCVGGAASSGFDYDSKGVLISFCF